MLSSLPVLAELALVTGSAVVPSGLAALLHDAAGCKKLRGSMQPGQPLVLPAGVRLCVAAGVCGALQLHSVIEVQRWPSGHGQAGADALHTLDRVNGAGCRCKHIVFVLSSVMRMADSVMYVSLPCIRRPTHARTLASMHTNIWQ
jgi:hypothetical protein